MSHLLGESTRIIQPLLTLLNCSRELEPHAHIVIMSVWVYACRLPPLIRWQLLLAGSVSQTSLVLITCQFQPQGTHTELGANKTLFVEWFVFPAQEAIRNHCQPAS